MNLRRTSDVGARTVGAVKCFGGVATLTLFVGLFSVLFVAAAAGQSSTVKPYTAVFSAGPVAGGATVQVSLQITNGSAQQTLGSADVTAAKLGSAAFAMTAASTGTIKNAGSLLELRNLAIAPMTSRTITITATTPCTGGSFTWGIRAKQSNNFSGPPGNDFTFQASGSNLVTSVTGGCRLEWVEEPASALKDALITGTDFDPSGPKVAVKAVDGSGNTLTALNSGTVTLTKSTGPSASFSGTQAAFVAGVATFASLKSATSGSYKFTASSPGFQSSPESDLFHILLTLTTECTTSGCETDPLSVNGVFVQAETSSSNFLLIGVGVLDIDIPPGCENFRPIGDAPVVVTDLRTTLSGDIFVTYGLRKRDIQKRFGSNSGEQFIPICAGAKRLALDEETQRTYPVDCDDDSVYGEQRGWTGKVLNADGTFAPSGQVTEAVCDPDTGYFFGILGSFQDYTKGIAAATNPTVEGWSSDSTYRYFTTRFPSGSGPGSLASVPWDGWKFG